APNIGVAARPGSAVGLPIGRARMDDGHVTQEANTHILATQVGNSRGFGNLRKKTRAVDERGIGIAVEEVLRKMRSKPLRVCFSDRTNIVGIEFFESLPIAGLRPW